MNYAPWLQAFWQSTVQRWPLWPLYRHLGDKEEMDIETELLYASRMMLATRIGGLIGWERERHVSDARFCQQCGILLSLGKCSGCGEELQAGTKFCAKRGKSQQ